jgi:Polyketide cyclase / dehydrase and lipid transport
MRGSVTLQIAAPAGVVYDLVSDITRIGEFSPETFEAEWLDGATGPAPDARFRGHVKRNGVGPIYWTTCRVTACEPLTSFGFDVVTPSGGIVNTWRYDLVARDGGTEVTESFQLPAAMPMKIYWAIAGWRRGRRNERNMRRTLERIAAIAESTPAT